MAGLCNDLG
jgi:deoxynucleoside triphosphate triphosphohydrolase SAMHD1